MSNDNATILDYASPVAPGTLRLPGQSRIFLQRHLDGWAEIVETFAGRVSSTLAVGFGVVVLLMLCMQLVDSHEEWPLFASFAAIESILIVAVIRNTWRKTILIATPEKLQLVSRGPLRLTCTHEWPIERIISIQATQPFSFASAEGAGRVEIVIRDQPQVVLFAGHTNDELDWVVKVLRDVVENPGQPSSN